MNRVSLLQLHAMAAALLCSCGGSKTSMQPGDGGGVDSTADDASASPDASVGTDALVGSDAMMGMLSPDPPDPAGTPCASQLGFPGVPVVMLADSAVAPESLDVADFTGDGKRDLVVSTGAYLQIAHGNGDGTYAPASVLVSVSNNISPRLGDLTGDSGLDLIYAVRNQTSVFMMPNIGGAFGSTQSLDTTIYSNQIELVDVNGDGLRDIVTLGGQVRKISVLLNGPTGFGTAATYTTSSSEAVGMAVGDISGDGKPDVIVSVLNGTLSVLTNDGAGAFGSATSVPIAASAEKVRLGDLNQDGKLDVLVTSWNQTSGQVSVLLNQGGNVLGAPVHYVTRAPFAPRALAVADVDGDGDLDVVAASVSGEVVDLLLGGGDGTLVAPIALSSEYAADATLTDVNGDGRADLITAGGMTVRTYLNEGATPLFVQRRAISYMGKQLVSIQLVDVDSDNARDLVGIDDGTGAHGSVVSRLATASWFTTSVTSTDLAIRPLLLRTADLDNDVRQDLIVTWNGVQVVRNQGDGTLVALQPFTVPPGNNGALAGDFDGDGFRDLVVTATDTVSSFSVTLFRGNGDGTVGASTMVASSAGSLVGFGAGDVNKDGAQDLVLSFIDPQTYGIRVLLGNGNGTFGAPGFVPVSALLRGIHVRDLSGDGHADLVGYGNRTLRVLLGDGTGNFSAASPQPSWGADDAVLADINGDGELDVVAVDRIARVMTLLLGNGDGTFAPHRHYDTGVGPRSVVVGDVDSDGRLDVLVHAGDQVSVLMGRCM